MRILLVEDDTFFQKFYTMKLTEAGFQVELAENGAVGLEKVGVSPYPDLIVLDLVMPVKDGFEFLRDFKSIKIQKNIPILVFSTLGQEQDITKAKEMGATDYVSKSFFDFDKLLKKINDLINK